MISSKWGYWQYATVNIQDSSKEEVMRFILNSTRIQDVLIEQISGKNYSTSIYIVRFTTSTFFICLFCLIYINMYIIMNNYYTKISLMQAHCLKFDKAKCFKTPLFVTS